MCRMLLGSNTRFRSGGRRRRKNNFILPIRSHYRLGITAVNRDKRHSKSHANLQSLDFKLGDYRREIESFIGKLKIAAARMDTRVRCHSPYQLIINDLKISAVKVE